MSAQYRSGRFSAASSKTSPATTLAVISKDQALTEADVTAIFTDADVINFADVVGPGFASPAVAQHFGQCLAKSMHTSTVICRGAVSRVAHFTIEACVATPLTENLSVSFVDLSNCGLNARDAESLSRNVFPWNRAVTAWSFADNTQLGDEGVDIISRALAESATVQRVDFRNTNLSNVGGALECLKRVPSLFQLDVSGNPGFESARMALSELDPILQSNLRLLHPPAASQVWPHDDLTIAEDAASAPPPATASTQPPPPKATPVRTRSQSSVKRVDSMPSSPTRPRAASKTASEKPDMAKEEKKAQPQQTAAPPADSPKPKSEQPAAAAASPPPKEPQAKATEPEAKKPAADPPAATEKKPATDSQARDQRPRSASRPQTQRAVSPSSQRIRVAPVDEGREQWKQHQEHYNQYIRSASSPARALSTEEEREKKAVRDSVLHPKYLFGKRVDAIRGHQSPQFAKPYQGIDKIATPADLRKLAPWAKQDEAGKRTTSVGAVHRIPVEGAKTPTYIKIVDGGEISYVNEDPRDLSYYARKVQQGLVAARGSGVFNSNVPRDVRWGVAPTAKGYVHKTAQAPDPGAYTVESDWEKNSRRLREQRRSVSATGRPMFGLSASSREAKPPKPQAPGPGAYEIP